MLRFSASQDLKEGKLKLTEDQFDWFASLLAVGALIGGPVAGILIDLLGRKTGIMLSALPFVTGWALIASAGNVYLLCLGRFLTGFACGMASLSAPTYIAEISSKQLRGLLGGGFQLAVVFGVLLAFLFGIPLSYIWLAILAAIFGVCMVMLLLFIPESPRWYFKNNPEKARKSLEWLRGPNSPSINTEIHEIEQTTVEQNQRQPFRELLLQKTVYKPLILSVALMFFQQFSGVNAVLFFSNDIFKDAGFSSKSQQDTASVILAIAQVVFTFVGCILMDRAGRRILLAIAGITMAVTCTTFSLYYILTEKNIAAKDATSMQVLSVGSLGVYISGFSIGWGPVPWLIMSEIFPEQARGPGSGIATATNWTFAFLVTRFFKNVEKAISPFGTFVAFAVANVVGVIFVLVFLPETKGKTLAEIEAYFTGGERSDSYERIGEESDAEPVAADVTELNE